MAVLSQEQLALRATSAVRSDSDAVLVTKCQKAEKEREELRASLKTTESQLDSVRRQLVAMEVRSQTFESDKFILKRDRAMMLKRSFSRT